MSFPVTILDTAPPAPPKRELALTAEQVSRTAEFSATVRLYSKDRAGRDDPNPAIGIRNIDGSRHHFVCLFTALPRTGVTPPPQEPTPMEAIERIIDAQGDVIYDELEDYIIRAGDAA